MEAKLIDSERLLSTTELAKELGVPERSIRNWITAGTAPAHYRLNQRTTKFRIEDVRQWLAEKYAA